MTPEEAAVANSGPIYEIGQAFMLARPTLKKGPALGFPRGWSFYFSGRGGVLGDVAPDVIAASFAFFPVPFVQQQWLLGRAVMEPAAAAAAYAEACQDWGREHLAGAPNLDETVAMLRRLAAAADPGGAPLFAGWRAMPLPDDAAGAAAQLFHVLREQRGALHTMAVLTSGMEPLEAVVASTGHAGAEFNQWPEPWPDPEPLAEDYAEIEELVDELVAAIYEPFTEDELEELTALVGGVHAHAFNLAV